jgi:hypothetical protein
VAAASERSRSGTGARNVLLRLLFAVVVLVPVAVLFVQVRQYTSDRIDSSAQEREGVQYLAALGPVTVALADAQTTAVAGRSGGSAELTTALAAMTAVDERLGAGLGSHDRWQALQTKITALADGPQIEPVKAYASYGALTDLTLSLYTRVRETSGLARDPGADTYYLQDGASRQLPAVIVAVGRLADQATLALSRPKADQVRTTAELLSAVDDANQPAGNLVEDLQRAVDTGEGTTVTAGLVSQLDKFRAAADVLSASTALVDGDLTNADVAGMAGQRSALSTAAAGLSGIVLDLIDQDVAARGTAAEGDRTLSLVAAGVAVLVLLIAVVLAVVGWRRSRRRPADGLIDDPSVDLRRLSEVPSAAQWERTGAAR